MTTNNKNNSTFENELDFKVLFKVLIKSIKLIVIITLVSALLSSVYLLQKNPLYETVGYIEVGSYLSADGKEKIIEPLDDLIKNIKIEMLYKMLIDQKINLRPLLDKLIEIKYVTSSLEVNENLMSITVNYITDRHSKIKNTIEVGLETQLMLTKKSLKDKKEFEKAQISDEIITISNEIEFMIKLLNEQNNSDKKIIKNEIRNILKQSFFIKNSLKEQNEARIIELTNNLSNKILQIEFAKNLLQEQNEIEIMSNSKNIDRINIKIPFLENKIKLIEDTINQENQNLLALQATPEVFVERSGKLTTLNQIIMNYEFELINLEGEINNLKTERVNSQESKKLLENSNLDSKTLFTLTQEKYKLESEKFILETSNLDSDYLLTLEQERNNLEIDLKILEANIIDSGDIFKLNQEKDSLIMKLKFLESSDLESGNVSLTLQRARLEAQIKLLEITKLNKTQLINEIKSHQIDPQLFKRILLGSAFGFMISIFIVFFRESQFKEKEL